MAESMRVDYHDTSLIYTANQQFTIFSHFTPMYTKDIYYHIYVYVYIYIYVVYTCVYVVYVYNI